MQGEQSNQDVSPKPRRSWKRISLRGLLLLTALIAVLISYFAKAHLENEITQLVKPNGRVKYPGRSLLDSSEERFAQFLGNQYCTMSIEADLGSMSMEKRVDFFEKLGRRRGLRELYLTYVDNQQLELIGRHLANVKVLVIIGNEVDDRGLRYLGALNNLKGLYLVDTSVTGTGFKDLGTAVSLETLYVKNADVSDAHLSDFPQLPRLKHILFVQTLLTNKALVSMSRVKSLERLGIEGASFTPEDLVLASETLPNLKTLNGKPFKRPQKAGNAPQAASAAGTN